MYIYVNIFEWICMMNHNKSYFCVNGLVLQMLILLLQPLQFFPTAMSSSLVSSVWHATQVSICMSSSTISITSASSGLLYTSSDGRGLPCQASRLHGPSTHSGLVESFREAGLPMDYRVKCIYLSNILYLPDKKCSEHKDDAHCCLLIFAIHS